jgi:hypothetical protein
MTQKPIPYGENDRAANANLNNNFMQLFGGRNTYTASRIASLADVGKIAYVNVAGANTFTVPPASADLPWAVDDVLAVCQQGAGATTFVAGVGVTISKPTGVTLVTNGQFAFAGLVYQGSDLWYATGNLTAA